MTYAAMREHAKGIASEDGNDERLVSGWFERGSFRGEKDQLDNSADREEGD